MIDWQQAVKACDTFVVGGLSAQWLASDSLDK